MVEYNNVSNTGTYRNGGVLMSIRWYLGESESDQSFSSQPKMAVIPDSAAAEIIKHASSGLPSLEALLSFRREALRMLLRSGEATLQGLVELVDETFADLPRLERQARDAYLSKAIEPTFDFPFFERVVTFLPETGKAFLEAFQKDPTAENAETVYAWSTDLDRTVSDYLTECSPNLHSISITVSTTRDYAWTPKRRPAVPVPLDLCAG